MVLDEQVLVLVLVLDKQVLNPSLGPSLYFATLLRLTPPAEGFPWDDLRKILYGGERMARVHSSEEILQKGSTP